MHTARLLAPALLVCAASSALAYVPDDVQKSAYGVKTYASAATMEFDTFKKVIDSDTKGSVGEKGASTYAQVAPHANATAYGSLDTGAMHLGAFTTAPQGEDFLMTEAQAQVEIWDTVTVYWGNTSVSRIPLTIRFDGIRSGPAAYSGFEYHGVTTNTGYMTDQDVYEVSDEVLPLLTNDPVPTTTFKVYARAFVAAYSSNSPYQSGYGFEGEPSSSDYTHTLKFMWDLPEGVTFTSASGVFNPQPLTQPVPEPASFAALAVGVLGLLKRRRRP